MAIAAFFNAEKQAEKILKPIFDNYNDLADKVKKTVTEQPKIMLNAPWKDTWFVPGGNSYMNNMIKDAGGNFIFANNNNRDSYPINIEKAYVEALKADYWLNPNAAKSLADIENDDNRLSDIPAFKNKRIYNNNARTNSNGGSDFWESGVMSPHIILKDLIKIFHPQLVPEHELVYFRQLQ
jgi:iron complex transport system substrate-binding protein